MKKAARLAEYVICWFVAAVLLLLALGVVFSAPIEDLVRNGGVRNRRGGDLFAGLVVVFGEPIVRAFFGTLCVALACLFAWIPVRRRRER